MTRSDQRLGAPEWLIVAGAGVFVLVLGVSAWWEADIRWLHFFQAWMYVGAVVLSLRGSRWGYFIGISAGGFWDYANLTATTFFFNGLQQLAQWARTGHLARPDLVIAVPAWSANLVLVVGCLWAYARVRPKSAGDLARFFVSLVLTTAFFAGAMAVFQPRYLGIFPRLLHPHLP